MNKIIVQAKDGTFKFVPLIEMNGHTPLLSAEGDKVAIKHGNEVWFDGLLQKYDGDDD